MSLPPARQGQPWTNEEDQRLTAAFQAGTTVAELAKKLDRSTGGIEAHLVKLGLVDAPAGKPASPRAGRTSATLERLLTTTNDYGQPVSVGDLLFGLVQAVDDLAPAIHRIARTIEANDLIPAVLTIASTIEERPVPNDAAAIMAAREEGYATGYAEGYGKAQAEMLENAQC